MQAPWLQLVPLATAGVIILLALGTAYICLKFSHDRNQRLLSYYASLFVPALALGFGLGHLSEDMLNQHAGWCPALGLLAGMITLGLWSGLGFLWQQWRIEHQSSPLALVAPAFVTQIMAELAPDFALAPPVIYILPTQTSLAFVVGLYRPRIYLAQWFLDQLTPIELAQVLAHELAHIRRRDNLLALISTIFWGATLFLPSSWWAFSRLLSEREFAADELAVNLTGKPAALARALVKVVAPNCPHLPITGFFQAGTLEQRVENLIRIHQEHRVVDSKPEYIGLITLTLLIPLPIAWLIFDLPHLLRLP